MPVTPQRASQDHGQSLQAPDRRAGAFEIPRRTPTFINLCHTKYCKQPDACRYGLSADSPSPPSYPPRPVCVSCISDPDIPYHAADRKVALQHGIRALIIVQPAPLGLTLFSSTHLARRPSSRYPYPLPLKPSLPSSGVLRPAAEKI